jgi:hypothetical protein
MPRSLRLSSIATCLCLALTGPLLVAPTANADTTTALATESDSALAKSADACPNDLKVSIRQMEEDGYWVVGEATVSAILWARPALECTAE